MDKILRGLDNASHLDIVPLERLGFFLIVKIDALAGLVVCQKRVPPVSCLDYLADEDLRFLLILLTCRCGLRLPAKPG